MTDPRRRKDATPWYAERPLLALLAVFVPLKLALMMIAQRHLDGDEAVIGVMAMHVARGQDFPFYFWGQHYGGGSALAAYLTALPFLIVGPSSVAFRLIPMLFSFAAVVLAYRLVQSLHGRLVASVATLLLLTSSALVEWFAKSRGGYVESTVFLLIILTLLRRMETGVGARLRAAFAIGLTGGLAYYVQENALPFVALGSAAAVWLRRGQRPLATAAAVLGGLVIAASPVVVYNLLHDWQNLDYVLHASALGRSSIADLVGVALRNLPALFQPHNFDCYPPTLDTRTMLEAAIVVTVALVTALRTIVAYLRKPSGSVVLATLSVYVLAFLAYALLSLRTQTSPRYFFNLVAPMLLLTGVSLGGALASLRERSVSVRAIASGAVLGLLIALGAYSHAQAFRLELVADAVWRKDGALACVWSPGGDLSAAVAYLEREGIVAVRSPYFSQWRIVFESGERIAASSEDLVPSASRRPELDRAVAAAPRVAVVLHCASRHDDQMRLIAPRLARKRFGDYCVYL
jgi:4-amino-4-deoxy-L-arabinose transferase-like glycosyltransferase